MSQSTETIENAMARHDAFIALIARILIATLFLVACKGKLTDPASFAGYVASQGGPSSTILAFIAGLVELVGGLAILVGFQTRWAALLLFGFTIVATAIGHQFWHVTDPAMHMDQQIHFMKNLVILGAMLMLFVHGPGSLSIDRR
jgi:putative oxidoreductase